MKRDAILVGAGLLGAITLGYAQSPAQPGDAKRGEAVAAQGTSSGVPPCAQCHAFSGASDSSGAFPRVAGQSAYYLVKQLREFASGEREDALMSPIAKKLSPEETADVAAYYADAQAPFPLLKPAAPELLKRGEQIAAVGDAARQIQSCNNCHGPSGTGEPPTIPYLAGQYQSYTALQIRMWQRGLRKNSPDEMAPVARKLDEADIAAVAAYYEQARSFDAASAPGVEKTSR